MNCYFAPLEGITGHLYRCAHREFFGGVDKYFSPFIPASLGGGFRGRELRDVLPENNRGLPLVPQLLTDDAEAFLHTAGKLEELGYTELNLNLGCPSGTVVSKGRGSGFLARPQELDRFLDTVFSRCGQKLSIKTRLGITRPEEILPLMEIYNRYPLLELIIHPRVQKEMYRGTTHRALFGEALAMSRSPVCYNGDLCTPEDVRALRADFPAVETVMLGRGLVANPGLAAELRGQPRVDRERLRAFHDRLLDDYQTHFSGDRSVLFKMKELWFYMGGLFAEPEKHLKRIKKAERLCDYRSAVSALFCDCELL